MASTTPEIPPEVLIMAIYHEIPNERAALAAAILYGIATIVMIALTIKTRSWFMITVAVTGLFQVLGWCFRVIILHDPKLIWYILQEAPPTPSRPAQRLWRVLASRQALQQTKHIAGSVGVAVPHGVTVGTHSHRMGPLSVCCLQRPQACSLTH